VTSARWRLAVSLLLVAAVAAVYLQVRSHHFVGFDDPIYTTENENLELGLSPEGLAWAFGTSYAANWIPLTQVSFLFDHDLFDLAPGAVLLENAALHALASVLLFLALARMTRARWASAFAAAVFALHPLHVESVAWASERKDVLSAVFFALALWLYARYAERPGAGRYVAVAGATAAGLLAKPMLVTLPFVLLLLDLWPLGRLAAPGSRRLVEAGPLARAAAEKLPLLALAAVSAAVTYAVQERAMSPEQVSLGLRLQNAAVSAVLYLLQTFRPTGLSVIYPFPDQGIPAAQVAGASLLLGALTALAAWALVARRLAYPAVGWLWYLGTLVPVIGIVQVGMQARADRYTYLPMVGIALALAFGVRDLVRAGRLPAAVAAAAGAAASIALAALSYQQVGVWRDGVALFEHAVRVDPRNHIAHSMLGANLLAAGRVDDARLHYRRALEIRPDWPKAHTGLGEIFRQQGRLQDAVREFEAALRAWPQHDWTHANLGVTYLELGRPADAVLHLERALALRPSTGLATIHANLGEALRRLGRLEEAEEHDRAALAIDPDAAEVHANLGFLLLQRGRPDPARRHLERALALGAQAPDLHLALASLDQSQGRSRAAADHYRAALRLRPGWLEAQNNLAWILATDADPAVRDPEAALRLAQELAAGEGGDLPGVLDTVAAAYAAAGRFEDAHRTAERALALARASGDTDLADAIAARARRFAAGEQVVE
jgi:tetratricopeptide (TPR) repeat protein